MISLYAGTTLAADTTHPLASKIATRFDLSEADVSNYLDDLKMEEWNDKQARLESRLEAAVGAKLISAEQKDAILEKRKEIAADREAFIAQQQSELKAWAKENGIDADVLSKLTPFMGRHAHRLMHTN